MVSKTIYIPELMIKEYLHKSLNMTDFMKMCGIPYNGAYLERYRQYLVDNVY